MSTRRGIAQTHIKIAAAAAAIDDDDRAQAELDLAAPTLEYLAKTDADDSRVAYDLASFYVDRAAVYIDQSQPDDPRAIELLKRAVPILEHLATLEANNSSWISNLARARVMLGSVLTRSRAGNGVALSRQGLAAANEVARAPDASIDVLEIAVRAGLEAEPPSVRNSHQTVEFAQRLADVTRRRNPQVLWLLACALRADGQTPAAVDAATQGLASLPGPDEQKPSRLRRLLMLQAVR